MEQAPFQRSDRAISVYQALMTLRFAPLPLLITGKEASLLLKGQDAANQVPGMDQNLSTAALR